jgi:DNA polymerase-3 subunit chi
LCLHLWTYDAASFLPHGSEGDGSPDRQPIYLTCLEENPNRANVLMLVDGMTADNPAAFDIVCDLFDGRSDEAVAAARIRWKACKAQAMALSYWQEGERGGWERRA